MTSAVAGTGISVSSGTGAVTISNTGVNSVNDGSSGGVNSGITLGGTSTAPTIATNLSAGTGITIANGTGTARSITNSSPASSIAITSGTNISVTGTNPTYSIATSLAPTFNSVTIGGTSNPTNFIKPYQIQDASSSVGSSAYLLSSQGTGSGISWIVPPQSAVYKVASSTSLTTSPTAYLTSAATLLSKGITITASLYFSVSTITISQIVITATLLGGSSGATTLMTQQLSLPLNSSVTYASMPISWLDTTAGTNTYKINLSHTGGVAQPQILVNSNMVVANAQ